MNHLIQKLGWAIVSVCFLILAQSCNNNSEQSHSHDDHAHENHATHDQDPISHGEGEHGHESMTDTELQLNNGAKWQADEPTNRNADNIIAIGDQFLESENKTLTDYHIFGQDVNEAINTMIRECTMEGAADQALHIWFLPLIEKASTLREATDTAGLNEITTEMIERMRMYPGYFE